MVDIDKTIDSVLGAVDDNFESGEERQKTLTERQKIDMTSRYILPQIIRPLIALIVLMLQVLIFVAIFIGKEVPKDLIWEVGSLNLATVGFYFNSRRNEKINAKKTEAAVKIEENKAKVEAKVELMKVREERRENRREARKLRKQERKG